MSIQEDGTIGVRPIKGAPTSHPWRWLATILGAVVICFTIVATVGTFVNGGLYG